MKESTSKTSFTFPKRVTFNFLLFVSCANFWSEYERVLIGKSLHIINNSINKMTLNMKSGANSCCWYNPPTTVSTVKGHMWTTASIRILFLCSKRNRAKSTQNKHLLWTGLCFQCGLEPLNESGGQFPKRPGRTNTSSFTEDKCFWRELCSSVLAVNTRVSGTNVTCDWWGTSGIEGQVSNHRGTLWKEANSWTQEPQSCTLARTEHGYTHRHTHILLLAKSPKLYKIELQEIGLSWIGSHLLLSSYIITESTSVRY